jgi:uncharacterized sodium:solute symporter family permease YidK
MKSEVNRWAKYGTLGSVIFVPFAIGFVYASISYAQNGPIPDSVIPEYHNTIYLVWGLLFVPLLALYLLWGKHVEWWHQRKLDSLSTGEKVLVWSFTVPGFLAAATLGWFITIVAVVAIALLAGGTPTIKEIGRQSAQQQRQREIEHAVRRGVEQGVDDAFRRNGY